MTPKFIKPSGFAGAWKVLEGTLHDTWKQTQKAQLLLVASSLAYTTILSIIPLLAVSLAVFQAFGGMEKLYQAIEPFILSNLAEGASDEVIKLLRGFIKNAHANALGIGGFIGLVFTSMSMLSSIEKAINQVWLAPMRRKWFQRVTAYWFFITLGPLALAVGLGAATSSQIPLANLLPNGSGIFGLTVLVFFFVYKLVPQCKVRWEFAMLSALITAVIWNLARLGYNLYTSKVLTYNKIYGSLGAVPILLIWIYVVWVVILAGAALTAALQSRLNPEEGHR